MNTLIQSYHSASAYPNNLVCNLSRENVLQNYARLLQEKKDDLFSDKQPAIDFWQCDYNGQVFQRKIINAMNGLYAHLRVNSTPRLYDPKSQFIFLQAPHSRENLSVTIEMFLAVLSYRQVMPGFLDFVFSFGTQEHAEDFHFSGFKHETRISPVDRGLRVPELERSGRSIQICYSLRSAEPAPEERFPWSIRQTAFYHSFDVESGQACWIVVKGNDSMRELVEMETLAENGSDLRSFQTVHQSFSSALATHLLFCEWSAQNWRWYINSLEEKVQEITRRTLDKTIAAPPPDPPAMSTKTSTGDAGPPSTLKRSGTLIGTFSRALTFDRSISRKQAEKSPAVAVTAAQPTGRRAPPVLPPGMTPQKEAAHSEPEGFQFEEVRRIQLIEERANETLLVLKTNTNVQEDLKTYYCSLATTTDFPHNIKQQCAKDLAHFENCIENSQKFFRMQQSRLETLLRILADRKTLLYGILDYQNMQFSKRMAEKGRHSAESMERMTKQMHVIAVRTKQETVSMKIITLVTLFFLPGTFISTLMSTDIIQYKDVAPGKHGEMFSLPALQLFLAISVPMMVLTFVTWAAIYYWVRRREHRKGETQDEEQGGNVPIENEKVESGSETDAETQLPVCVLTESKSSQAAHVLRHKWQTWFPRVRLA